MIDAIKNNQSLINATHQGLNDLNNSLETDLLQNTETNTQMTEKASSLLEQVETAVVKQLENNSGTQELYSLLEKIRDSGRTTGNFKKSADERLLDRIKKHQKEILVHMPIDTILKEISLPPAGEGGDITDIVNQITSYYTRLIYQKLMNSPDLNLHKENYIQSLKGYYTELSEYEVLSKYFEGLLNTFHSGSVKINNLDTEMDLVFSNINNISEILEKNLSINTTIEGLNSSSIQQGLADMREQINWFGEQSKSWQLKTNKFSYSIGHRANLLNSFLSESNASDQSALQGIQFLARQKNILLALGASNVLINTGGERQWMGDFIKNFRQANYLLAFSGGGKNKLNNHIILTQLYNKSINIKN